MWGRSSVRSALPLACAAAACAVAASAIAACKRGPTKPEADPAQVQKLAEKMAREVPTPAAVRDCTPADFNGTLPLTFRSLALLSGRTPNPRPEDSDWINPTQLDAPAVRLFLDSKDKTHVRQAAAELLAAPAWLVYKVDYVNAPMALGVKELKIGTIGTRIIRYEKTGLPACVLVFNFQNTQQVSDDAIAVADQATIEPAVAKSLRDDLTANWIKLAPRGAAPGTKH